MENFELIDNLIQITVLSCAALAAAILALRHKSRRLLILALAYACFVMGTGYFVLYLAIFGTVPQIFYVAEISWLASYTFFLSLEILQAESITHRFSLSAAVCGAVLAAVILLDRIFGPSYFMSALFALAVGAIGYLCVLCLQKDGARRWSDAWMLLCVVLQILLYLVSDFMTDFTQFNLYFALDLLLTSCLAALLPVHLREVRKI